MSASGLRFALSAMAPESISSTSEAVRPGRPVSRRRLDRCPGSEGSPSAARPRAGRSSGPATAPIWIQFSAGCDLSRRQQRHDRLLAGSPEIVEHDVDLGRASASADVVAGVVGQPDDAIGPDRSVRLSRRDRGRRRSRARRRGAWRPGRPAARVAGRAEDQHALTGLDRHAAAERDPGRHRRVHRGGDSAASTRRAGRPRGARR